MEYFRTHTDCFNFGCRAVWDNHEFLGVQTIVGVCATVYDIHHWTWQNTWVGVAINFCDVFIQWNMFCVRNCVCQSHGNRQYRVCTQFILVWCAVQCQHFFINFSLLGRVHANQGRRNDFVNVFDRGQYTFAHIVVATVTQFKGFE